MNTSRMTGTALRPLAGLQFVAQDPTSPHDLTLSNGLRATAP
jgi:hypothetical protein